MVIFLHEFECFRRAKNSFFVSLHILGRDFFELCDAIFHEAFVHQRVAEHDAGLAGFGLLRIGLEVGTEFLDRGRVFLHLLEAIRPSKNGLAAVSAVGVFCQILAHEIAAGLKLLVERIGHSDPVGGVFGAAVLRVPLLEITKRHGGIHVFFGLQQRESPHEAGLGCPQVGGKILGKLEVGRCGLVISHERQERIDLHVADLGEVCGFRKKLREFLRGRDGSRPILQRAPAADDIERGLLGGGALRQFVDHVVHDQRGLAVARHLQIGDREA